MRDKQSLIGKSNRHHCTFSACHSNKTFVRFLFAFDSCYYVLSEWNFRYFFMYKCISTIACVNDTVQFTFFLVMRLNSAIVMSCDLLVVILVPFLTLHFFIIKTWKWTEKTCPKRRHQKTFLIVLKYKQHWKIRPD